MFRIITRNYSIMQRKNLNMKQIDTMFTPKE